MSQCKIIKIIVEPFIPTL